MSKSKPQRTTTDSTSTTDIPQWVEDASRANINFASGLPNYMPYTGQGVAGLTPQQLQAIQLASGNAGVAKGLLDPALTGGASLAAGNVPMITGETVARQIPGLLSPFTQNVVDASNREIDRAQTNALQQNGAAQARAKAFGGDRAAVMDAETTRNFEDIRAKTNAGLYSDAYNKAMSVLSGNQNAELQGRVAGGGMVLDAARAFQNMGTSDVQGLLQAGGVGRDVDQQGRTFDYNEFLRGVQSPFQKLQAMIGATSGAKYDTTTNTKATQTQEMHSSPLSGLLGLGLSLAGSSVGMPWLGAAAGGVGNLFNFGSWAGSGFNGSGAPLAV